MSYYSPAVSQGSVSFSYAGGDDALQRISFHSVKSEVLEVPVPYLEVFKAASKDSESK